MIGSFLDDDLAVARLIREYKEHGSLVIAVDFDNTIYDYHQQGLQLKPVIRMIHTCVSLGMEVYVFTANNDHNFVRAYCKEHLYIDDIKINESSLDHLFKSRKPFYSILLDDRAGLSAAYNILKKVLLELL